MALLGTADASVGFDEVGGFQGESSAVQAVAAACRPRCPVVRNGDHDLEGPIDPSAAVINSRLVDFFDRHLR